MLMMNKNNSPFESSDFFTLEGFRIIFKMFIGQATDEVGNLGMAAMLFSESSI